jgi:hypothetical protein
VPVRSSLAHQLLDVVVLVVPHHVVIVLQPVVCTPAMCVVRSLVSCLRTNYKTELEI